MMFPQMPYTKAKFDRRITQFLGLNLTHNTQDGEFVDTYGLSTESYPILSQRKDRTVVDDYENAEDIYEWDGKLIVAEGGVLYYDGEPICNVSNTKKQFCVINTKLIVFPDKMMIDLTDNSITKMDEEIVSLANSAKIVSGKVLQIAPARYAYNAGYSAGCLSYIRCLDHVPTWSGGAWQYTEGEILIKDICGNSVAQAYGGENGDQYEGRIVGQYKYFIPYKTEQGVYVNETIQRSPGGGGDVPFYDNSPRWSDYQHAFNSDGIYGVFTAVLRNNCHATYGYSGGYWWSYGGGVDAYYDLIDASSGRILLSDYFSIGDYVDIGNMDAILGGASNDRTCVKITAINDTNNQLTFGEMTTDFSGTNTQTNPVSVKRNIPNMAYICESNNRLWGVSNSDKTIYASALGLPMQFWQTGTDADAYSVAVGSEGDFTAICEYGNGVCAWKENRLHKILGSYPSEYYGSEYIVAGVQAGSYRSLVVINEVLYYKGVFGVYAYTGGTPSMISSVFGTNRYTEATGGKEGHYYYLSMLDEDGQGAMYVYDIMRGLWIKQDRAYVSAFAVLNMKLHLLENGVIYKTTDEPEVFEWGAEFVPFLESLGSSKSTQYQPFVSKGYTKLFLRMNMSEGSWMKVEVAEDNKPFKTIYTQNADNDKIVTVPLRLGRCDSYKVRLSGKGRVEIRTFGRECSIGSER